MEPLASGHRIDLIVHALPTCPSLCDRASTHVNDINIHSIGARAASVHVIHVLAHGWRENEAA